MHLFFTLITAGVDLVFFFIMAFFHVVSKPIGGGGWVCSECGYDITARVLAGGGYQNHVPQGRGILNTNIPGSDILKVGPQISGKHIGYAVLFFLFLPILLTKPIFGLIILIGAIIAGTYFIIKFITSQK